MIQVTLNFRYLPHLYSWRYKDNITLENVLLTHSYYSIKENENKSMTSMYVQNYNFLLLARRTYTNKYRTGYRYQILFQRTQTVTAFNKTFSIR